MKNEITTPNQNGSIQFMFKNEELNKYSAQIAVFNGNINASAEQHMINASNNLCQIALIMAEIDNKELYKEDGFKSAAEYAMETFDYKKSQAFNLVRVGKKYGERLLSTPYNFTQLVEALPMGTEKFDELSESGELTPDMKATEIRDVAKEHKVKERKPAKAKEYYYAIVNAAYKDYFVGPATEADFIASSDEVHKFKTNNGRQCYAVVNSESGIITVWERFDTIENESEEKGE